MRVERQVCKTSFQAFALLENDFKRTYHGSVTGWFNFVCRK